MLLANSEFHLAFQVFRSILMLAVGFFTMLIVLHMLYYLGLQNIIYRSKPPTDHWNRRFFPAILLLIIILLILIWGMGWLLSYTTSD